MADNSRISMNFPFHYAFPVHDLKMARSFYLGIIGCLEGRSAPTWVDVDCFGHQLSLHLDPDWRPRHVNGTVDGHPVPLPHFGVVLDRSTWDELAERLVTAGVDFILPPQVRFQGQPGEQATFFLLDPSGNALEFKGMPSHSLFEH